MGLRGGVNVNGGSRGVAAMYLQTRDGGGVALTARVALGSVNVGAQCWLVCCESVASLA